MNVSTVEVVATTTIDIYVYDHDDCYRTKLRNIFARLGYHVIQKRVLNKTSVDYVELINNKSKRKNKDYEMIKRVY